MLINFLEDQNCTFLNSLQLQNLNQPEMSTVKHIVSLIGITALVIATIYLSNTPSPVQQVTAYKDLPFEKNMNFTRFMGLWYSIASKPNIFEKKCKCGQTVDTLVESLVIDLSESCLILGKNITSNSKVVAKVPGYGNWTNLNGPAIADYWIVQMDPEYAWAIIGKPSRKGFWIMARDYKMEKSLLDRLIAKGKELEFDLSDLEMEDQSCHTSRRMWLNENNIKTESE